MTKPVGTHARDEYTALGAPILGEPAVRLPDDDPLLRALQRAHGAAASASIHQLADERRQQRRQV